MLGGICLDRRFLGVWLCGEDDEKEGRDGGRVRDLVWVRLKGTVWSFVLLKEFLA